MARNLHAELLRELPPDHRLSGRRVEAIAWREGANDDVLFRHTDQPDRFTVVHLSWRGRSEINAAFPIVEFDGTFSEFLAKEGKLYVPRPHEGG